MDDVRTPDSQEPPDPRNDVKDGNPQSQNQQRRIEHATTATVDNDRYTTICTLEIRPPRDDTVIATNTIQHGIFDAIKEINESARSYLSTKSVSPMVKTCLPKWTKKGIHRLEEV